MRFITLLVLAIFFLLSCQTDSTEQRPENVLEKLAQTPEGIVRQYQSYLDKNEFDKAKRVSTAAEQERLEMIKGIITGELLESSTMTTAFIDLNCKEDGNKAFCIGKYAEDGENFQDTFYLEKVDNQWLVTITEDVDEPVIIKGEELLIE
ncbi:MAG: hypothetical protein AB8G22_19370 [Saprospiraceae bacterium]